MRDRFGRCDVLIANAGIYPMASFDDYTWEQWRAVMAVNVDSLFHLTKAFLPGMRAAGWGRIVAAASNGFYSGLAEPDAVCGEQGRGRRLRALALA